MINDNAYRGNAIGPSDRSAACLSFEQLTVLMAWCGEARYALWEGLSMQEVLNVYHVSIEYYAVEKWLAQDPDAHSAWNAVTREPNHLLEC